MKKFLIVLAVIALFASCDSSKKTVGTSPNIEDANDTIRIANEELEYEILIIEPGFNSWLASQQPRGFYGQTYLESRNVMWVQEYNMRVRNFQQFDTNLYQQEINYEYNVDYGYEVNYLLFNYFVYFQRTYKQKFPGSRG